jgi:hypothetical protein
MWVRANESRGVHDSSTWKMEFDCSVHDDNLGTACSCIPCGSTGVLPRLTVIISEEVRKTE